MQFEWDEEKAKGNLQKHGISFVDAIAIFDDPNRIEDDSTKPEYGETRTRTIGMVKGKLIITVISTDRNQKIRIISARRARKNEEKHYYHG